MSKFWAPQLWGLRSLCASVPCRFLLLRPRLINLQESYRIFKEEGSHYCTTMIFQRQQDLLCMDLSVDITKMSWHINLTHIISFQSRPILLKFMKYNSVNINTILTPLIQITFSGFIHYLEMIAHYLCQICCML